MAVEYYTYRGEEGEVIPDGATHVTVTAKVIPAQAFYHHRNIEEIICSENVEKIERYAFGQCRRLRRVVMRGVLVVEIYAFDYCTTLTDVECRMLEIVGEGAFNHCESLRSISLPSARTLGEWAFIECRALTSAIFSDKLKSIEQLAFCMCISLERITIPLKDGIITDDSIFLGCEKLKDVDLVEGEALRETVAALHFEKWRNDMIGKIDAINQTLPDTPTGHFCSYLDRDGGEKARVIREWIQSVFRKINHYKAEHRHVLDEAATALQYALPQDDIVMKNVLPFLELSPYTFGVVEDEMEEVDIDVSRQKLGLTVIEDNL